MYFLKYLGTYRCRSISMMVTCKRNTSQLYIIEHIDVLWLKDILISLISLFTIYSPTLRAAKNVKWTMWITNCKEYNKTLPCSDFSNYDVMQLGEMKKTKNSTVRPVGNQSEIWNWYYQNTKATEPTQQEHSVCMHSINWFHIGQLEHSPDWMTSIPDSASATTQPHILWAKTSHNYRLYTPLQNCI